MAVVPSAAMLFPPSPFKVRLSPSFVVRVTLRPWVLAQAAETTVQAAPVSTIMDPAVALLSPVSHLPPFCLGVTTTLMCGWYMGSGMDPATIGPAESILALGMRTCLHTAAVTGTSRT